MAGLESLIKLHKHELDEKRQVLAKLYDVQDILKKEQKKIEDEFAREKDSIKDGGDTSFIFADYSEAVKIRLEVNAKKQRDIEENIEEAKDSMMETFSELKKYEKTQELREKKKQDKLNKKESQELDNIGIERFRRKE